MIERNLIILFVIALILVVLCIVSVIFVLKAHDRETKFQARMQNVIAPVARHPSPVDEEISLTR
ncbi:MAG TPA: hypothetical protein VMV54_01285, partial [Acidocella sp.]|nr:hypothetical protein [Acidocella sp.]